MDRSGPAHLSAPKPTVVVIYLKNHEPREIIAQSFGDAARKVLCGPGQIIRFQWKDAP
jgi:hypothetical protein